MTPKEDPAAREARLRERQLAEQERTVATQDLMKGMTADYNRLYGRGFSAFR